MLGRAGRISAAHLAARAHDTVLPFLTLQYLYGLARAQAPGGGRRCWTAVRRRADSAPPFTREVWREVALPGCEGLYAYARGDYGAAWRHLASSVPRMAEAGGSHAQRDLFEQILLDTAVKSGRVGHRTTNAGAEARSGSERRAAQHGAGRRVRRAGFAGTRASRARERRCSRGPGTRIEISMGTSMSSDPTEASVQDHRRAARRTRRADARADPLSDGEPARRGLSCLRGIHRRAPARPRVRRRLCACGRHAGRQRALPAHQCHCAARRHGAPDRACTSTAISMWCKPAADGPWTRSPPW